MPSPYAPNIPMHLRSPFQKAPAQCGAGWETSHHLGLRRWVLPLLLVPPLLPYHCLIPAGHGGWAALCPRALVLLSALWC